MLRKVRYRALKFSLALRGENLLPITSRLSQSSQVREQGSVSISFSFRHGSPSGQAFPLAPKNPAPPDQSASSGSLLTSRCSAPTSQGFSLWRTSHLWVANFDRSGCPPTWGSHSWAKSPKRLRAKTKGQPLCNPEFSFRRSRSDFRNQAASSSFKTS